MKSLVSFTPNVDLYLRKFIQCVLGVSGDKGNDRYLGLPSHVGRNKRYIFDFL